MRSGGVGRFLRLCRICLIFCCSCSHPASGGRIGTSTRCACLSSATQCLAATESAVLGGALQLPGGRGGDGAIEPVPLTSSCSGCHCRGIQAAFPRLADYTCTYRLVMQDF